MTTLNNGIWKEIDNKAKNGSKVFVRRGTEFAWARYSHGQWLYFTRGIDDRLDFTPTEYRVS